MNNNLLDRKKNLRKEQFLLRKKLFSNVTEIFDKHLFEELFKEVNFENTKIVSSFISVNTEINTNELNDYIIQKKKILCLPVVLNQNEHLVFRKFTNNKNMIDGFMNIKEPSARNKILIPDLLFVPCLAFDNQGFRLGYGGGYYDRTFNNLNKIQKKYVSVGYAFNGQMVPEVPKDKFDIKLDYVITEKKIYSFI